MRSRVVERRYWTRWSGKVRRLAIKKKTGCRYNTSDTEKLEERNKSGKKEKLEEVREKTTEMDIWIKEMV